MSWDPLASPRPRRPARPARVAPPASPRPRRPAVPFARYFGNVGQRRVVGAVRASGRGAKTGGSGHPSHPPHWPARRCPPARCPSPARLTSRHDAASPHRGYSQTGPETQIRSGPMGPRPGTLVVMTSGRSPVAGRGGAVGQEVLGNGGQGGAELGRERGFHLVDAGAACGAGVSDCHPAVRAGAEEPVGHGHVLAA